MALTLSDAFDVYAKTRQTALKRLSRHAASLSFETTVHNEKKTTVVVRVVQQFQGPIKVLSESIVSKGLTFSSREWNVPVPAGGQTVLTYRVQAKV